MVGIRRSTLNGLDPDNMRRIGPRPSLPAFKRTPEAEEVTMVGPESQKKNLRTVKPIPEGKKQPRRIGVPDPARAERGLSIRGLYAKQPKYQKMSAEDIIIRSLKKTKTKGGLPAIVGRSRDLTTKPIRMHQFSCIGLEKDVPLHKQKRVKISCSCEFWMYYSEYALWTWGAANIIYSNGQPAVIRNPGNYPLACKHTTRVLREIIQRNL